MSTITTCFAALILLTLSLSTHALTIQPDHPRIFLTADQLPALAERCKPDGPVNAEYTAIKNDLDSFISRKQAINGNYLPSLCVVYQVEKYLGHNTTKYVDYLVKGLWGTDGKGGGSTLSTSSQWFPSGRGTTLDGYMGANGTWFAWDAMAYDWFYDALTPQQRKHYGNLIGQWLHSFMGLDPKQPAHITLKWGSYLYNQTWAPAGSYAWGNYYGRDGVGSKTLVALAIHKENTRYEKSVNEWLASFDKRVPTEFIPFLENMGGAFPNGPDHGRGTAQSIILTFAAWKSATGQNLFNRFQKGGLKETALWPLFGTMPHNLAWGHINDNGPGMIHSIRGYASRTAPLLASTYDQPYAQWMTANYTQTPQQRSWPYVLWYDPNITTPDSSTLPLAYHFKGTGQTYMRSDWNSPDATWAYFIAGPQFIGYQAEEDGSFQIYKAGGLAMRGGTDRNSGTRPPSMNTVLIYNPDNKLGKRNDGGTLPGVGSINTPEPRGTMTAFHNNTHFTYACADLAHAYNPATVKQYTRQFIYLRGNPECFVVYDRITSTKPTFPKLWLLHVMNKPAILNNSQPVKSARRAKGLEKFTNANQFIISTFTTDNNPVKNGRNSFLPDSLGAMMCQTILPENAGITVRGGKGHDNWGCPYDKKDNRNFDPQNPGGEGSSLIDRSWWRIEIEPQKQSADTEFLHVLLPITMPKSSPLNANQFTTADFPTVTQKNITKNTITLTITSGKNQWLITLQRTSQPAPIITLLTNNKQINSWHPHP